MIDGVICVYCKKYTLNPCKSADDAEDCPNDEVDEDNVAG